MKGKLRKLAAALACSAGLLAATPAWAGIYVFYYHDYVGGTPAGYAIYCDDGSLLTLYGQQTNILIYHHQDTGC